MSNDGASRQAFNSKLAHNSIVSMISSLVYMVTRMMVPPFTLKYLGMDIWGIWSLCFVFIAYIGMSTFGIDNVYIRYTALFEVRKDVAAIGRLISTGLSITLPGALIALVVMWFALPTIITGLNITVANREIALVLFFGTAATFLVQLTFAVFDAVLIGLQRMAQSKLVHTGSALLETALIIFGLTMGWGAFALMAAFGVRILLQTGACFLLVRRALPNLRLGVSEIDRSFFPFFFKFGGVLQFNGLLNMFASTLDRLIFSRYFSESAAGFLDIGQKLPRMAMAIPESISGVIYPAVANLSSGELLDEIELLYIRAARYTNMIIGLLMGFMAPFSLPLMLVWLGPDAEITEPALLLLLFCLPYQGHVLTGPATAVFKGMGKPFRETVYPLLKILAFLVLVGGALFFGEPDQRRIATLSAVAIFCSTLVFVFFSNVKLGINHLLFLRRAVLPGLVPYVLGGLCFLVSHAFLDTFSESRLSMAMALFPTGVVYLVLCAAYFWVVCFDDPERCKLRAFFKR